MDLCLPDEIRATKGDLVAFQRRIFLGWIEIFTYFHFAVCTVSSVADRQAVVDQNGDRFTVGLDRPMPRRCYLKTRIVEETIRTLCHEHGCQVNNLEEAAEEIGLRPLKPDAIVERARDFLTLHRVNYNLVTDNCEHFATKCRYEKAFSLQVRECCPAYCVYLLFKLCSDFFRKLWCSRQAYPMNGAIEVVNPI